MYFVRTYKAGGADHDPRQKIWAEFECDCCGEKTNIDVTNNKTFDYERTRKCPHCKSIGEEDFINSLKSERDRLIDEREKINKRIFEINSQIEYFEIVNNKSY